VDLMWAAYRNIPTISAVRYFPGGSISFTVENLNPNKTNLVQFGASASSGAWRTIGTNVTGVWSTLSTDVIGATIIVTNVTGTNSFIFQGPSSNHTQGFYRVVQLP